MSKWLLLSLLSLVFTSIAYCEDLLKLEKIEEDITLKTEAGKAKFAPNEGLVVNGDAIRWVVAGPRFREGNRTQSAYLDKRNSFIYEIETVVFPRNAKPFRFTVYDMTGERPVKYSTDFEGEVQSLERDGNVFTLTSRTHAYSWRVRQDEIRKSLVDNR